MNVSKKLHIDLALQIKQLGNINYVEIAKEFVIL